MYIHVAMRHFYDLIQLKKNTFPSALRFGLLSLHVLQVANRFPRTPHFEYDV